MTFYESAMRTFLNEDRLLAAKVFCDKMVMGELNQETNVKITLHNFGYIDHYNGFLVEIINKHTGKIDSQAFKFSDIIGDFPLNGTKMQYHIWCCNSKAEWYAMEPTEEQKKKIMQIVKDYISLFE